MRSKRVIDVLSPQFLRVSNLGWFIFGVVIAITAWIWGESTVPFYFLKFVFGVNWFSVMILMVLMSLGVMAIKFKNKMGLLSRGDFRNFSFFVGMMMLKTIMTLFGFSIVALICWISTGNVNALISSLITVIFCLAFIWFWVGLGIMRGNVVKD